MSKMIVGRETVYLEVFEIDTDKFLSIRDDLDLCQRILWAADPVLSQRLKSSIKEGRSAVKFLYRIQDCIRKNPIYPAPTCPEGLDECPRYKKGGD